MQIVRPLCAETFSFRGTSSPVSLALLSCGGFHYTTGASSQTQCTQSAPTWIGQSPIIFHSHSLTTWNFTEPSHYGLHPQHHNVSHRRRVSSRLTKYQKHSLTTIRRSSVVHQHIRPNLTPLCHVPSNYTHAFGLFATNSPTPCVGAICPDLFVPTKQTVLFRHPAFWSLYHRPSN